jgi:ADP-ribosylglycohydrolase
MIGAIAGDIIGSVHEFVGTKSKEFELFHPMSHFTDDTVLTIAVAQAAMPTPWRASPAASPRPTTGESRSRSASRPS